MKDDGFEFVTRKVFEDNYRRFLRRWETSKEMGAIRECRSKRERDKLCSDKVVAYGQRTVAKDGSFRFCHSRWQSDLLIPLAGVRIGVHAGDVHVCHVEIYTEYPEGKFLMEIARRRRD